MSTKYKFPHLTKTPLKGFAVQVTDGRRTEVLFCCPLVLFLCEADNSKKRTPGAPSHLCWDHCTSYQELPSAAHSRRRGQGWHEHVVVDLRRSEVQGSWKKANVILEWTEQETANNDHC